MKPHQNIEGGCWPTPTQELLLRASLLNGPEALEAWQQWRGQTDVEKLDFASSRMLPLLHCNLEKLGVESAQLARYKSVSRFFWLHNQLLFERATQVLALLESVGIRTLVLKGGALATLYYPKVSARPMGDFDILVPTPNAPRAFNLMLANGYRLKQWRGSKLPPERAYSLFHAHSFVPQQQQSSQKQAPQLDIHQHVFQQTFDADDEFWNAAVPLEFCGVQTHALCPEDMLLHICAHGVHWDDVPPLRWIADAALILQAQPDMDWNRIVAQARLHQLSLQVRYALEYLGNLGVGVTVPVVVLHQLAAIPTSRAGRREWRALTEPRPSHSVALKFWLRTQTYARWNATNPLWQRPFSFPSYLQFFWGLDSPAQVLPYGLKRLAAMLKSKRDSSTN